MGKVKRAKRAAKRQAQEQQRQEEKQAPPRQQQQQQKQQQKQHQQQQQQQQQQQRQRRRRHDERRRRDATVSDSDVSDVEEEEAEEWVEPDFSRFREKEHVVYNLCEEDHGALYTWFRLSRDEMAEVLEVHLDEFVDELMRTVVSPEQPLSDNVRRNMRLALLSMFGSAIDSHEMMTHLRSSFVFGLQNSGVMSVMVDPVSLAAIRVMERHLVLASTRRAATMRVFWLAYTLCFFYAPWWVTCVVLPVVTYFAANSRPWQYALLPFEDSSPRRYEMRVHAMLSFVLLDVFNHWMVGLFMLGTLAVLVEFLLLYAESRTNGPVESPLSTQVVWWTLVAGDAIVLYGAMHDVWVLLAIAAFLFPKLARLAVAAFCLSFAVLPPVLAYGGLDRQRLGVLVALLAYYIELGTFAWPCYAFSAVFVAVPNRFVPYVLTAGALLWSMDSLNAEIVLSLGKFAFEWVRLKVCGPRAKKKDGEKEGEEKGEQQEEGGEEEE